MNAHTTGPAPSPEKQKHRILVVEDNVAARYLFALWLRMEGYDVVEAATANEAIALLGSPLGIDLVVTDVHMPGSMTGIDLSLHIRTAYPAIRIIVVSGIAQPSQVAPGTPFFRKPYDPVRVTERIREMLAGQPPT